MRLQAPRQDRAFEPCEHLQAKWSGYYTTSPVEVGTVAEVLRCRRARGRAPWCVCLERPPPRTAARRRPAAMRFPIALEESLAVGVGILVARSVAAVVAAIRGAIPTVTRRVEAVAVARVFAPFDDA